MCNWVACYCCQLQLVVSSGSGRRSSRNIVSYASVVDCHRRLTNQRLLCKSSVCCVQTDSAVRFASFAVYEEQFANYFDVCIRVCVVFIPALRAMQT